MVVSGCLVVVMGLGVVVVVVVVSCDVVVVVVVVVCGVVVGAGVFAVVGKFSSPSQERVRTAFELSTKCFVSFNQKQTNYTYTSSICLRK